MMISSSFSTALHSTFGPIAVIVPLALAGCGGTHEGHQSDLDEDSGKIPITTASAEAREAYLEGRDLTEKIRVTDARPFYEAAVAADPGFALAHLGLANTSTNADDFFSSLNSAAELAGSASEGERNLILATQAGAQSDPEAQKDYLTRLVQEFPEDERAHNLMGGYFFGRQDYQDAITHFEHSVEINPDFSPPYNNLGYLYRTLGDYDQAETNFKRYIDLLPNEANPYDSYAELLMKAGRFDESIETYRKALAIQPDFVASLIGIGNNQIFLGKGDDARSTFGELSEIARSDGERRQALFWTTASYVYEGNFEAALETARERLDIAAGAEDWATVSGDHCLIGNLQTEAGDTEGAFESFGLSVEAIEKAEVAENVKAATRRNQLAQRARAALKAGDVDQAGELSTAYLAEVDEKRIPFEVRQAHELAGLIALARGDAATAVSELASANQQDPRVLYSQAIAYQRLGEEGKALEICAKAADFNGLNLNYAFVRSKAKAMLEVAG